MFVYIDLSTIIDNSKIELNSEILLLDTRSEFISSLESFECEPIVTDKIEINCYTISLVVGRKLEKLSDIHNLDICTLDKFHSCYIDPSDIKNMNSLFQLLQNNNITTKMDYHLER